jgi:hypothetical protein
MIFRESLELVGSRREMAVLLVSNDAGSVRSCRYSGSVVLEPGVPTDSSLSSLLEVATMRAFVSLALDDLPYERRRAPDRTPLGGS